MPFTLDTNADSSSVTTLQMQLMIEASSPHWRRSRTFRNRSEEYSERIYAECNLMVNRKETLEKEDKKKKNKQQRNSRGEKMRTED